MVEAVPRDRFVRVNGLRLHYLDWGGRGKPVLVLLHGLTGHAHAWDPFVRSGHPSAAQYRILALDQRGHGDSDHAKDYHVAAFASDIAEFAHKLGLEQFDLLGHSLGARNAMSYAGDGWRSLRHLVLVDFGPEMERQGALNVRSRTTEQPPGFRDLQQAVTFFKGVYPTRSPEQVEQMAGHALRLNYAGRLVWKHDPELRWITGSFGLSEVPHLWQQIARVRCPTLIVRGETSDVLGRGVMGRMLQVMPAARAVEVRGAGHGVPQDQPEEFWQAVEAFLAK
ncbi:MAG: alpha/beta hydrolase [Chloroflexi bacterium]|nr:alpha/beta hydrolase [Chloroflexota bacterium]